MGTRSSQIYSQRSIASAPISQSLDASRAGMQGMKTTEDFQVSGKKEISADSKSNQEVKENSLLIEPIKADDIQ